MRAFLVPFTADGLAEPETVSLTNFDAPATPATTGEELSIVGISIVGFTSVALYHGTDNTGTFIGSWGPGTYTWTNQLDLPKGVFIDVTGTGSGALWAV